MNASPIVVGRPVVSGSRITVAVRAGGARGFLRQREFCVEYQGFDDLAEIDEGLLVVPALGTILTVAYALGVGVVAERVDERFASSADALGEVFGSLYPEFGAGRFHLDAERVATTQRGSEGAVMLFSGGLDSSASLLAHREEVRDLVTVWGADVPRGDLALWQSLRASIVRNPLTQGKTLITAASNLRDLVDGHRLGYRFRAGTAYGSDWWSAVQHGLGVLALTVPVAARQGRCRIYIAASLWAGRPGRQSPWGSVPAIDNRVAWSNGDVVHDLFALTRQEKLQTFIAPFVASGGTLELDVCYHPRRGTNGMNCGRCEKCIRTMTGLLAAKVDPTQAGIPVSAQTFGIARDAIRSSAWDFSVDGVGHQWADIQSRLPPGSAVPEVNGARDYLGWLAGVDFGLHEPAAGHTMSRFEYLATRALRHLPGRLRSAINKRRT